MGPIKPQSPLFKPKFAANLVLNAKLAFNQGLTGGVPIFVVIGGDDEDKYAKTPKLKQWITWQRDQHRVKMQAIECPGGYHELDNEPDPMGTQVRAAASAFAERAVAGDAGYVPLASGPCKRF